MRLWHRLRRTDEVEALRADLAKLSDPELTDLRLANGSINIELTGQLVQRMAVAIASQFHEGGAENYMEIQCQTKEGERYAVTIQKVGRKSPHELRVEAEKETAALRAIVHGNGG